MLFGSLVDLQKIWDETFDNFLSVHIHLSLRCNICLDNGNAMFLWFRMLHANIYLSSI